MNVIKLFNNKNNMYFAHGSGTDKKGILDSIMKHGIRCSHGSFQFTSIYLGTSEDIKEYTYEILENWFYKNSSIVFVVSFPKKYFILEREEISTLKKEHSAFYYIPTKEEQKEFSLMNKPHVYSEFIVGYYNSITKEFVENENYYEKLENEKKKEILNKIEENYKMIIEESCGIEKYKEVCKKYKYSFSPEKEDIIIIDVEKDYDKKLKSHEIPEIPKNLRKFVYIVNGKIFAKNKLPKELEKDYEIFRNIHNLNEGTRSDEIDIIYDLYASTYEKKFNKKAYIAQPNGTKTQAIKAIKLCLERNEDLLDKIYYPNKTNVNTDKTKYLNRTDLCKIIDDWNIQNRQSIIKEAYVSLMKLLEEKIKSSEFEDDYRYVTFGRREFLMQEFKDYLIGKKQNNQSRFFNAFINLDEFIRAESSFFNPMDLPSELKSNFHKILIEHDEYNKQGIICKKEKDDILNLIQEFKIELEKENE